MDEDVERQAPHGDTGTPDKKTTNAKKKACWIVGIGVTALVVTFVCIAVPTEYYRVYTQYSVGIDSVTGLDPATGLSFNLTLSVASRSHGAKACVNLGLFVEVFYHGVHVAASDAETQKTCARPRKTAELPVVAKATGVPVGHVLQSLEADMRHGAAVFDVKLHVPASSYGGIDAMASWVTDCKGTRVGHGAVMCVSPDQS